MAGVVYRDDGRGGRLDVDLVLDCVTPGTGVVTVVSSLIHAERASLHWPLARHEIK